MPSRGQEAMIPMTLVTGHWKFTLGNPRVPSLLSPAEPRQSCRWGPCLPPSTLQILSDSSHWPTLSHIPSLCQGSRGVSFRASYVHGTGRPSHRGPSRALGIICFWMGCFPLLTTFNIIAVSILEHPSFPSWTCSFSGARRTRPTAQENC